MKSKWQTLLAFLVYITLFIIASHILIIGPITEILKDETVFTTSYENIAGLKKISYISLKFGKIGKDYCVAS